MKDFLIKNSITIIAFSIFFGLFIHVYNRHLDWEKYFDEGETLYTIGKVTKIDNAKGGPRIHFSFILNDKYSTGISHLSNAAVNSVYQKHDINKFKKILIGKKFFVKFSVEKPKYAEIYFNLPVHEEFRYEEGQTWKKPLKRAVAKEDIYGNYR